MFNSLTFSALNNTPVSRESKKPAGKSRSRQKAKQQASKTHVREAVELQWLKQLMNTKVIAALMISTALLTVPFLLPSDDILPIGKIVVSGDYKQIDMTDIDRQLDSYLGQSFFSVDIKLIQQKISQQPWIQTVSVKRVWPDRLFVNVTKKQAVARWDDEHLLSRQAVIFEADAKKFTHLPQLKGYEGQTVELLNRFSHIQKTFSTQGIKVAEMFEDNKGALTLVLNEQLKVNIGSADNEIKIKYFLAVYPQHIKPRLEHIKYIDFRYSNGFSIAWKDEYLEQTGEKQQRGSNNV